MLRPLYWISQTSNCMCMKMPCAQWRDSGMGDPNVGRTLPINHTPMCCCTRAFSRFVLRIERRGFLLLFLLTYMKLKFLHVARRRRIRDFALVVAARRIRRIRMIWSLCVGEANLREHIFMEYGVRCVYIYLLFCGLVHWWFWCVETKEWMAHEKIWEKKKKTLVLCKTNMY